MTSFLVRSIQVAGVLAAGLIDNASLAAEPPQVRWNECVGRSELTLPSDAEAALYEPESIRNLTVELGDPPRARFGDGEKADYSDFEYRGSLFVSRPLEGEQARDLLRRFDATRQDDRKYSLSHKVDEDGNSLAFTDLPASGGHIAWKVGSRYTLASVVDRSFLAWKSSYGPNDKEPNAAAYQGIVNATRREKFSVPAAQGVCIPSIFIPDTGAQPRMVAATYRLKDHPDITVWFQDRDWPADKASNKAEQLRSATAANDFFWNQNYQSRKDYRYEWLAPHPIDLGGATGVSTFVRLKRADDSVDYGFFASMSAGSVGDLAGTSIQMFVIQDSRVAKAKGIPPLDKAQVLEMAENILHSIRKHPTAPSP